MVSGAHAIIYSTNAEADRAFFCDVLRLSSVDAGHGWLIFVLQPAEIAVHPSEENGRHEIYFMCEDLDATMQALANHGVSCGPVMNQPWGRLTQLTLPGGGSIGVYQPRHPIAARSG